MPKKPTYEELEQRIKEFERSQSERKRTEEAELKSEEKANRIAEVNKTLTEIGRIISSTLTIEEVFNQFAAEVKKIIPFDRVNIGYINHEQGTYRIAYTAGLEIPERHKGKSMPFSGLIREVIRGKSGVLLQPEREDEFVEDYQGFLIPFRAGIRSTIVTPLISKDQVNGILYLSSLSSKAYSDSDLVLAESVASQIAGAITSARIYDQMKEAEEALRESEEKYRTLTEKSRIGVFIHQNERFVYINERFAEMHGYRSDELLGKEFFSLVGPEFKELTRQRARDKIKGVPQVARFETPKIKKDGTLFWCEVISNRIEYRGSPAIMGQLIDITERKRTEAALRDSEARYKSIFQDNLSIIFIRDPVTERLIDVNPAACSFYGYSRDEMIGMELPKITHSNLEIIKKRTKKTLGNGKNYFIAKHYLANGESRDVEVYNNSMQIGDKKVILAIIHDITERKRTEDKLRESEEKLARSKKMESLGLLAGGVAHDLNNVLSGIVSYPELLLLDLPKDSKFRKPIETIQESGNKAVAIVQDLLTIARGVASTKSPLNLNDIIREYLESPEFIKLEQYHPTVRVKTDLDTHLLNISGSLAHIRKVIMNLVSNASEAIEGSGNVVISTRNRYVDRPIKGYEDVTIGEYAVLTVSDDGSGIASDYLEKIFEPFFTKKVMGRSGTGLGLAVVWNIVQDHKGQIDLRSNANGTTFELYFPITRDEMMNKVSPISIEDYKGCGETVLVVDDVESQREISCKMLDALGYRTNAVSSGEDAVEYLKENTVDLILLDMIMDPGINGRETYERILKIHPNQKAIIVSGFAETDEVKKAQELGAGQYIRKPLTLERIGLSVKKELSRM